MKRKKNAKYPKLFDTVCDRASKYFILLKRYCDENKALLLEFKPF